MNPTLHCRYNSESINQQIPVIPTNHRGLWKGEEVQEGDLIPYGQEWIEVSTFSIGLIVKNYGFYIRKVKVK